LAGDTDQPVFDKLDNDRPNQTRCDFQRTQGESGFGKLFRRFAAALCINVNLLFPEGQKDDKGANGRRRRDPGTCLFSERAPNFPRNIQFITQTSQVARHPFT
jgi:hypothetical protein